MRKTTGICHYCRGEGFTKERGWGGALIPVTCRMCGGSGKTASEQKPKAKKDS